MNWLQWNNLATGTTTLVCINGHYLQLLLSTPACTCHVIWPCNHPLKLLDICEHRLCYTSTPTIENIHMEWRDCTHHLQCMPPSLLQKLLLHTTTLQPRLKVATSTWKTTIYTNYTTDANQTAGCELLTTGSTTTTNTSELRHYETYTTLPSTQIYNQRRTSTII